MKKYLAIFLIIFSGIFYFSTLVQAEEEIASSTMKVTQINARILPLVWYSTLEINDRDNIKIYAGIQNNSGLEFTGQVLFLVNEEEIARETFISTDGRLLNIGADWVAIPGSHTVQVKVLASLGEDKELVSYETDKDKISVKRKITADMVQEATRNTISNIITKIDEIASSSANKVEGLKKPIVNNNITNTVSNANSTNLNNNTDTNTSNTDSNSSSNFLASTIDSIEGSVLGTSTGSVSNNGDEGASIWTHIYNWLISTLAFLIRNWPWVIVGMVLIYFGLKVKRWGSGDVY